MKSMHRWLHVALVLCLVLGWAGYAPVVSPAAAQADDSLPLIDTVPEQEYLADSVSLQPASLAEEEAINQANLVREAADRARALASTTHTADEDLFTSNNHSSEAPEAPTTDLTVGSAPCTYPTITAAIAAANPGDRLLLEGGVTFT